MASDNRSTTGSAALSPTKRSSFSIENILSIPNDQPQEARNMEILPHRLTSSFPLVVPTPPLLSQALRPSIMDFNAMQMLPPLPLQNPSFEDFLMAHQFPAVTFNMGYPRQGIPMPGLNPFIKRRKRFMRKPKQRPLFAHSQIQRLEKEFGEEKYLTETKRAELSKELGMTETQVKTWYQNRRTKWRKEIKEELNSKARTEENANWEERGSHVGEDTMLAEYNRVPHNMSSASAFASKIHDARTFVALESLKPRFVYS